MTETMKFGPDWIRSLSSVENTIEAPKYQLADHRYGREEMLALYNKAIPAPENLSSVSSLYVEKSQAPLSVLPMTTEEIRIWNMSFNNDHLGSRPMPIRSATAQSNTGDSGHARGRGMLMDRGRGRGGPRPMYHYNTKSYGENMESNPLFGTRVRSFERTQSHGSNERSWSERNGSSDYNSYDWNGYSENGLSTSPRKDHHTNRLSRDETSWRRRPGKDDDDTQKERRTTHRTNFSNDRYEKNAWSNWRDSSERNKDRDKISSELMETGRDRRWIRSGTSPSRTQRKSSECRDDNLPEWATENAVAGGGTFDSSGAFHGSVSDDEEDRKMKSQRNRFKKKVEKDEKNEKDGPIRQRRESSNKNESQGKNDGEKERDNRRLHAESVDPGVKKEDEGRILITSDKTYEKEESPGFVTDDSMTNHNRSSQIITNNSNYIPNFKVNGNSNLPLPESLPPVQMNKPHMESRNHAYMDRGSGIGKEEDLDGIVVDMVSKIVADDERFQDRLGRSDEYNKWYYRDPNCEVQGPFTTEEMSDWYRMGYFKESAIEIRRGTETRYQTMEELMSRTEGGRSPFNGEIVIPLEEVAKLQNQAAAQQPQPKPSLITNSDSLEENLLRQQRYQQQLQFNMLNRRNELIQEGMRYFTQQERYRNLTLVEQQRLLSQYVTSEMDSQFPAVNFNQNNNNNNINNNNIPFVSPHLQQQQLQQMHLQQQLQQQQKLQEQKSMDMIQHTLNSVPLMGNTIRPQTPNLNTALNFPRENQTIQPFDRNPRNDTEINPLQSFLKQLGMPQDQPIKVDAPWPNNGNLPPAFNAQHWLSQVGPIGPSAAPIATPNWMEPPPPTTVTMKTERQVIEESIMKELEKRRKEELEKRNMEDLKAAEAERQLLMMLKNHEQRNKSGEEHNEQLRREQAKSAEEERIRLLLKLEKEEEKKRKKEIEEEKRKKKQLEEENKRILEEQNKKKKEEEAKKREYEKRKEEEQKKKAEEEKRLEKEKKKQEQEKKKLEQKKKKDEEKKKTTVNDNHNNNNIQKKEDEKMTQALKRIQEQRQQADIAKSKKLPKSQSAPTVSSTAPPPPAEKKKKDKQKTDKTQMKWDSKLLSPKVKSLTEIQAEEQKQLKEQIEKDKKERIIREQKEQAEAAAAAKESNPWLAPNAWENGKPVWVAEATTTVVNGKKEKKKKEKIEKPSTSDKSHVVTLTQKGAKKSESKPKVKEEAANPTDELSRWSIKKLSKLKRTPDGVDVSTFVTVLNYAERKDEIKQSVTNYLVDKVAADNFISEYLSRRPEIVGNNRKKENEPKKQQAEFTEVKGKMKKSKKSKMSRVDSKILGFNVTAAPDRINVGDRDYVE